MKRFSVFSLLVLSTLFITARQAQAAAIAINFDEFGNGTTNFPGGNTPLHALAFTVGADPTAGVAGNVLIYTLPTTVVSGDLLIQESVGTTVVLSDVVRFVGNQMIFYSDRGDGVDAVADSGLPTNSPFTNIVSFLEVGPEGNNGLTYNPVAGNPGFVSVDFQATYNIVSDSPATPEPASMLLMAAGIAGLGIFRKLRVRSLNSAA
jgi:hypothetical protein